MKTFTFCLLLLATSVLPVQAAIEAYEFKDSSTEAEYKQLIKELRCLVCQNQNLADSDADLAKDLRQQTYELLQQGKNRQQIVEYMVDRYGDFVLYRPPVKSSTFLLWVGPFLLLGGVLLFVVFRVKQSRKADTAEQESLNKAREILSGDDNAQNGGKS